MKHPAQGSRAGEESPYSGTRFLAAAEHSRTRTLWEEAFPEDTPRFLEYYKAFVEDHNRILADEEKGEIVSMVHLNPYRVMARGTEVGCTYLVAVATKMEFRHQGRMKRLLRKALTDCRERGEPFAYLMPAAEEIYTPFGFRTVAYQSSFFLESAFLKETDGAASGRGSDACAPARYGQMTELAAFSERMLAKSCAVYAKRDSLYFERIFREQEAVNGKLLLFHRGDAICGYCRADREDGLEIRELLLDGPAGPEDYADALRAAAGYFREKLPAKLCGLLPGARVDGLLSREIPGRPVTMARIANLEAFAGLLRADRKMERTIRLTDGFLPENSGLWKLYLAPEYGRMQRIPDGTAKKEPPLCLTIEAFTDAAFGAGGSEELIQGLSPLAPVYLQELV